MATAPQDTTTPPPSQTDSSQSPSPSSTTPTMEELLAENAVLKQTVAKQQEEIATLTTVSEQRKQVINELRATCERLGSRVPLDKEAQRKVDWLRDNLKVIKFKDLENKGHQALMSDEEFERSLGKSKNIACFRYAIRKIETGMSDPDLFVHLKGQKPVDNQLKTFARAIRIGDFLLRLTFAHTKKYGGSELTSLLRSNAKPFKSLAELNAVPEWVTSSSAASTVQDYVSQSFLAIPGIPFAIADILKNLQNPVAEKPSRSSATGPSAESSEDDDGDDDSETPSPRVRQTNKGKRSTPNRAAKGQPPQKKHK